MIKNIMLINIFVGVGFLGCAKKVQIAPSIEKAKAKVEVSQVIRDEPIQKIETRKVIKQVETPKVIKEVVVKQKLEPIKKESIPFEVIEVESEEEKKAKKMKYKTLGEKTDAYLWVFTQPEKSGWMHQGVACYIKIKEGKAIQKEIRDY